MRLTRKRNIDGANYIFISDGTTPKSVAINKLGKLEDLEEQLGCPLYVFLGLATHEITEIYIEYDDFSGNYASPYCTDEDIVVAYVSGIYDNNEIDGLYNPEWKIETNMGTFPLSDYKEHFWLKKDKSE